MIMYVRFRYICLNELSFTGDYDEQDNDLFLSRLPFITELSPRVISNI